MDTAPSKEFTITATKKNAVRRGVVAVSYTHLLFEEDVDFDTFSTSDFRAAKVKEYVAVPKSKKLLQFTLDDGTGTEMCIRDSNMTWAQFDLTAMIERGQNDPAIIMWSLGNVIDVDVYKRQFPHRIE